jgi:hypothetical protein
MKIALTLLSLLLAFVSFNVMADVNKDDKAIIYLGYCSNYGAGVNYSFQSCVNNNFSSVGRELGGYFSYCANYGDEVSYSFTSCVNSGFSEAARLLGKNIYLQNCYNFDQKNLDFSFISCVNSNYSEISRAISQRP